MSIISPLLNQSITSISSVTEDEYTDKTSTVLYRDIRCRWQEKVTQVTNTQGELVTSSVEVWTLPEIVVAEDYRIIKDSTTYVVVAYAKMYDINGNHDHTKIYLR